MAEQPPEPVVPGEHRAEVPKEPLLQGRLYDYLKQLALVWLPALGTLYFALAGIWGLPAAEQVSGTILAVDTFLGIVLKISSTQYDSAQALRTEQRTIGVITPTGGVNELSGNPDVQLKFTKDPAEMLNHDEIILKVGNPAQL